ncbi:MAG: pimeloyl-ACP methyl ester carboxylesterase [Verrucomicrobiales bacterium]
MRHEITEGNAPSGALHLAIPERNRDETTGHEIQLAFRDTKDAAKPILVLLPGSPVSSTSLSPLMRELDGQARLIVPDLAGFGGSTLRVADYSTRAHARNVWDLLDKFDVKEAHVLGYSMGGGVALQMADIDPKRLRSLILVSLIGVQELELLGDYTLNHAAHGLQLAALSGLQEGFPHFGKLDHFPLNRYYARNFFDTDQRPFRQILTELHQPTLIMHGKEDFLVPLAAAQEHHRLVPQSDMAVLEKGDHLTVIRQPERMAPEIMTFVDRVESGSGRVDEGASP